MEESPRNLDQQTPSPPASRRAEKITADHPLMRALLAQYIGGLPARVRKIIDCTQQADLEQLRRLTHQLKGSGGSYGFPKITQLAARAEASIVEGAPLRQIRIDVQALIDLVRSTPGYEIAMETVETRAA